MSPTVTGARPRLVIAAPRSGAGKTTVAVGVMAALRARGTRVAGFKVGPDYIDPSYHRLATGHVARNLDPVLQGREVTGELFAHGSKDAEISVIEGVMGMFDGRSSQQGQGSTADVAQLLEAPVLLVVDCSGQAHSLAALLHGFRSFSPEVRIAGVVLNRVGSAHHEQVLREACEQVGLPVYGVLRIDDQLAVPSRHLGLFTPGDYPQARATVDRIGQAVAAGLDLTGLMRLASHVPASTASGWEHGVQPAASAAPRIAVAAGPAFCFRYAEHTELLQAAGAEIVEFDPLVEEQLPENTQGLLLPGGYPEAHAAELAANEPMRRSVARAVIDGLPTQAECGGLLYLSQQLEGSPMCGVVPGTVRMSPRLTLGYRDAVCPTENLLHPQGTRVTGHEFHRTEIDADPAGWHGSPCWAWQNRSGHLHRDGVGSPTLHAGYLHVHPAARPAAVSRFVNRCAA